MTREEMVYLLPAITHFAEAGHLWYYNEYTSGWFIQSELFTKSRYEIQNIIGDEHIEARKAFVLGEEIECIMDEDDQWDIDPNPTFDKRFIYRPKPKEVYEWQWIYMGDDNLFHMTGIYYTKLPNINQEKQWTKFKPSKRIKR